MQQKTWRDRHQCTKRKQACCCRFCLQPTVVTCAANSDWKRKNEKGKWPSLFGADVYQQTLGIIGLGAIGKEVARRASGFSMTVLAYDPYIDRTYARKNGIEAVSLDALLQQSDFVTIHIPLLPETRHLIGERELQLMKKVLISSTPLGEELLTKQHYTKHCKHNNWLGQHWMCLKRSHYICLHSFRSIHLLLCLTWLAIRLGPSIRLATLVLIRLSPC